LRRRARGWTGSSSVRITRTKDAPAASPRPAWCTRLDGIFVCPHHPDEGCACRKPAPGLVQRAQRELGVSPENAIVIGDKASDVELARNVGALAVFVRSGNVPEEEQARMAERGLAPDYVARDLTGAVRWILEMNKSELGGSVVGSYRRDGTDELTT